MEQEETEPIEVTGAAPYSRTNTNLRVQKGT